MYLNPRNLNENILYANLANLKLSNQKFLFKDGYRRPKHLENCEKSSIRYMSIRLSRQYF